MIRIIPTGTDTGPDATGHITGKRIPDNQHVTLIFSSEAGKNSIKKLWRRFLRTNLTGDENSIQKRKKPGGLKLMVLGICRAVRNDILAVSGMQLLQ